MVWTHPTTFAGSCGIDPGQHDVAHCTMSGLLGRECLLLSQENFYLMFSSLDFYNIAQHITLHANYADALSIEHFSLFIIRDVITTGLYKLERLRPDRFCTAPPRIPVADIRRYLYRSV